MQVGNGEHLQLTMHDMQLTSTKLLLAIYHGIASPLDSKFEVVLCSKANSLHNICCVDTAAVKRRS